MRKLIATLVAKPIEDSLEFLMLDGCLIARDADALPLFPWKLRICD